MSVPYWTVLRTDFQIQYYTCTVTESRGFYKWDLVNASASTTTSAYTCSLTACPSIWPRGQRRRTPFRGMLVPVTGLWGLRSGAVAIRIRDHETDKPTTPEQPLFSVNK